jgi:NAD(P)H-dependent FMN reductase
MAIVHNTGQLAAAVLVTATPELAAYYPALFVSAIVTGRSPLAAQFLLLRLRAAGVIKLHEKHR